MTMSGQPRRGVLLRSNSERPVANCADRDRVCRLGWRGGIGTVDEIESIAGLPPTVGHPAKGDEAGGGAEGDEDAPAISVAERAKKTATKGMRNQPS